MKNIVIDSYRYESDFISLHGKFLSMKCGGGTVRLSKNQMKLFICLTKKINEKQEIIDMIWGKKEKNKENETKFNKLIYRTRITLTQANFPSDMLLTIPHFGVCINQSLLSITPPRFGHII